MIERQIAKPTTAPVTAPLPGMYHYKARVGSSGYVYSQLNQLVLYPGGQNLWYDPLGRLFYDSAGSPTQSGTGQAWMPDG